MRDYYTPMPEYFDTPDLGPAFYDLEFAWVRPPLTANQRMHWRQKASVTAAVRTACRWMAQPLPVMGRCEVTLTWTVTDRRRRDADNLVPTLKALCDGLVDAGVVHDDTPDLMVKHMPVIVLGTVAGMRLRVARLGPEAIAA